MKLSIIKHKISSFFTDKTNQFILNVDKPLFYTTLTLLFFGWIFSMTISPVVASKVFIHSFTFAKKQTLFIIIGIIAMLFFISCSKKTILTISFYGVIICAILMFIVIFNGEEIKGSKRWLRILGVSIQPSDIVKPFLIVVNAMILKNLNTNYIRSIVSSVVFISIMCILCILEPDFGMTISYIFIALVQVFIANIAIYFIGICIFLLGILFIFAYVFLPHARFRITSFLFESQRPYQVKKSLEAISNGGLFGRGLGEGVIKFYLPDSHADYIFSAIVEECGYLFAIFLILMYLFLILRMISKFSIKKDSEVRIIGFGVIAMFLINVLTSIGVNINILPSKGTTLPFLSYGGSSILSFSIAMAIAIKLSRDNCDDLNEFEIRRRKLI